MQLNCDPSIFAWIIANLNECEYISCSSLSFSLVVVVVLFWRIERRSTKA